MTKYRLIHFVCIMFVLKNLFLNGLTEKVNNVKFIKQAIVLLPLPFNEGVYN